MDMRIMEVEDRYCKEKKVHSWSFEYNPLIEAEELKKLTSHCEISRYPDCEYNFIVKHNGITYSYWSDGDDLIIAMAQMCILSEMSVVPQYGANKAKFTKQT
jgi:hypothetical protein